MKSIKFLCIVILEMTIGGAEAFPSAKPVAETNVLDFNAIANFPGDIPAMLQPGIYEPAGFDECNNGLRYVYFTIPSRGGDKNIYFPADGSQPTTLEAIEYSCANIDNRPESPITEWYMQMFGVTPCQTVRGQDCYINAGWSVPAVNGEVTPQRIIQFCGFEREKNRVWQTLRELGEEIDKQFNSTHNSIYRMPDVGGIRLNHLDEAKMAEQWDNQTRANIQNLVNQIQQLYHDQYLGTSRDPGLLLAYSNALKELNGMLWPETWDMAGAKTVATIYNDRRPAGFDHDFRWIATTSVGRVLLYRLLIEIRRLQRGVGVKDGIVANDADGFNALGRPYNRHVTIRFGEFSFGSGYEYSIGGQPLCLRYPYILVNSSQSKLTTIAGPFGLVDRIELQTTRTDVSLFHELIHWFHRLRAPGRVDFFEGIGDNLEHRRTNVLWLIYWGHVREPNMRVAEDNRWWNYGRTFTQEEILTILGMPNSTKNVVYSHCFYYPAFRGKKCYLEGDDLCENLYRAASGTPLRFGYNGQAFQEDGTVIRNVISATDSNISPYQRFLGDYRMD